jgi:hypothetical protein
VTNSEVEKFARSTARAIADEMGLSSRTWLSLQEAARYLGYSEQTLSFRNGAAPPSVLISARARRFNRGAVDKWIENGGATNV